MNFEMRELLVTACIRPEDIASDNTVAYDKIAEARISYGGRGHISDVQQPRRQQLLMWCSLLKEPQRPRKNGASKVWKRRLPF